MPTLSGGTSTSTKLKIINVNKIKMLMKILIINVDIRRPSVCQPEFAKLGNMETIKEIGKINAINIATNWMSTLKNARRNKGILKKAVKEIDRTDTPNLLHIPLWPI